MKNENSNKENPLPSPVTSFSKKELRKIAEDKAKEREPLLPKDLSKISQEEMQAMIHDLTVHQIELEMQNEEMMRLQLELNEARTRYFDIYDMAPVGYLIISEQSIVLETNLTATKLLGVDRRDLVDHRISPYILQEDQNKYYALRKALFDSGEPQECELRIQKKDGLVFWGHIMASVEEGSGTRTARLVLSDISRRKADELRLVQSEEKYRLLITSMNQGLALFRIITDNVGMPVDYIFLDINQSFTRYFGYTKEKALNKKVKEIVPRFSQQLINFFEKIALTGEPDSIESFPGSGGKYYSLYAYTPQQNEFAVLVTDVTDRMVKESRITYLSYHDQLTGLYNRRFYEEEMLRLDTDRDLPLSIAMGDVNGLKLINDSFGHMAGDELLKMTAEILKEGCRADDIIARLGGDEFVIILPKTDSIETQRVIERIQKLTQKVKVNDIGLSISFGYETKTKKEQKILDIFKLAEDHMYHNKLKESSTLRSRIIDVIVNILYEKNKREMQHSKNVSEISSAIAAEMNLDIAALNQIKLAGLMHDIGKIGLSEEVLNGLHAPSTEDWKQIRKHPEIGYRILSSSDEFADIAISVLDHHERWDGKGYPKGLKGESIPLAARIIAVAEAFDAMTGSETYKSVMGTQEAEAEIRKGSGKQFDPEIASIMLDKILKLP
ncbi:MAG: HD domain-containing phosphohydrolase [Eubacteriales bacterium]